MTDHFCKKCRRFWADYVKGYKEDAFAPTNQFCEPCMKIESKIVRNDALLSLSLTEKWDLCAGLETSYQVFWHGDENWGKNIEYSKKLHELLDNIKSQLRLYGPRPKGV